MEGVNGIITYWSGILVVVLESAEIGTIVTVQAIFCAKPHETASILDNAKDRALRQFVL